MVWTQKKSIGEVIVSWRHRGMWWMQACDLHNMGYRGILHVHGQCSFSLVVHWHLQIWHLPVCSGSHYLIPAFNILVRVLMWVWGMKWFTTRGVLTCFGFNVAHESLFNTPRFNPGLTSRVSFLLFSSNLSQVMLWTKMAILGHLFRLNGMIWS